MGVTRTGTWVDATFFEKGVQDKQKNGVKVLPTVRITDALTVEQREAAQKSLTSKIEKLKKYKVMTEDMAEILEKSVDEISLHPELPPNSKHDHRQHVYLQQPFHKCSSNISNCSVRLELKGSDSEGNITKSFGKFFKRAKEVIPLPNHNLDVEAQLDSGAILKVN